MPSTKQQTDRELALAWWKHSGKRKIALFNFTFPGRDSNTATDEEIEIVWRNETQELTPMPSDDPFTPGEREVLWYYWVRVKGKGFWEPAQCFGHTWQIIGESTYYTDDQMEKIEGKILSHFVENAVKNF